MYALFCPTRGFLDFVVASTLADLAPLGLHLTIENDPKRYLDFTWASGPASNRHLDSRKRFKLASERCLGALQTSSPCKEKLAKLQCCRQSLGFWHGALKMLFGDLQVLSNTKAFRK